MSEMKPEHQGSNSTRMSSKPSDARVFPCTWYAVAWLKQLKKKPLKIKVIGREIVLFRDLQGSLHAIPAYCPHRGADLSLGRCNGDTIQCAYHGWCFSGDGECVRIPAHPDRQIPYFAHMKAYPVAEKAGLIWVYPNAETENKDLPDLEVFHLLEDKNYVLSSYQETWKAHLTRVVESVLDVAHLSFVHRKTIGKRLTPEIPHVKFTSDHNVIQIENGGAFLEYWFPQQWLLRPSKTNAKAGFLNYVTFTPVDQEETIIFGYAGRAFARGIPGLNAIFSRFSRKILREDQLIVESQHPRPIPEALRMEAHVPSDAPQVRFRQRWYEFLTNEEPKVELD